MTNKISAVKTRTAKRGFIALSAFLLVLAILLVNILRLDILGYEEYRNKTFEQLTTTSRIKAERGNIYDANMNLLATTSTTWRISASTKQIREYSEKSGISIIPVISKRLSKILNINEESLNAKLSNTKQLDITIEPSATEDEYNQIIDFITQFGLDDVIYCEAQSARYYPYGTLAAHVLGFTGSDNQGLYGLEYYYESTLRGKDGYYLYAKDANGVAMPGGYTSTVPPTDGASIITTLDGYIQSELEAQLEAIVENHDVTSRVCGIVMDTRTGAILAMATSSPFNPNSPYELDELSREVLEKSGYREDSEEYKKLKTELMQVMWSNKAVSETYEPGSTFKIVTVAAALDSGVADMDDTFSCIGYHNVGGWRIKCHKTTGHGSGFSLAYGLQMSCNPTMMSIAERIGSERFYSYVEKFGYLEKTGIDLPSEAKTIFHDKGAIGPTELATASFGQRFKVSIINQITAIAAIANGGYLVKPYLVEKVVDSSGNILSEHQTAIKDQVVSPEVAKEIATVLEEGVSGNGGAKNAYVEGFEVAAKTGTSQKFDKLDENGNSYLRIGSTVAFAPSDESGIAVIIVVDEPQSTVKYGSTVAAPYVSALLTKVLPYLEYETNSSPCGYEVGNYIGMNSNSAAKQLSNDGISYEIIGGGNVILSQIPSAGIEITKGLSVIYLYTVESEVEQINMPDLRGMSAEAANNYAVSLGLNIKIVGVTDLRANCLTVTEQSIPPGTVVKKGSVVTIKLLRTDFED